MSNPYYVYNDDYIPGGRINSESVDSQFRAIEDAFDLLAAPGDINNGSSINAEDTGTSDAVVVDTGTGSTLVDGQLVSFPPANTNTGPTVISVNGNTNQNVVRNDGRALQAGDLVAGVPCLLIYDLANTRWVHVGATAVQALGRPRIIAVTASRTLEIADEGCILRCTNAGDITITIPTNASVALPVGFQTHIYRFGAGEITVAAASGAVLRTSIGARANSQYSTITPSQTAADDWVLLGDAKV
jgi:hypothetical protein